MIYPSAAEMIGNTPLMRADRFAKAYGIDANLVVKLESRNPGGSAKDRIARSMIFGAEQRGDLQPGATIIEATSGNTGVGLAVVAAARGYRVVLTMPESMSQERRKILEALGVTIVLTNGQLGMEGANERAEELLRTIPGSVRLLQFENADNPTAHEETTGPEIWKDCEGRVDALIAGVGTGGTICGAGRFLKRQNPGIRIVAVQPADSPVLTGGPPALHGIQGLGANFIPKIYDPAVVDQVVSVTTESSVEAARLFMRAEGILIGISCGAALAGARMHMKRCGKVGETVVVILPDTGERYLSTVLFD